MPGLQAQHWPGKQRLWVQTLHYRESQQRHTDGRSVHRDRRVVPDEIQIQLPSDGSRGSAQITTL